MSSLSTRGPLTCIAFARNFVFAVFTVPLHFNSNDGDDEDNDANDNEGE